MSAGRKINCVQIQFFVQWRRNSGIVEAIAEHDSALGGSSEWFAQLEFEHNFFSTRRPLSNTLPHPRKEKKCSITCGRE